RKEMMKLEDKTDSPIPKVRLLIFRQVKHILAVEVDRSCGGAVQRPDNMEQRALSCSRGSDNRTQLPPLNLSIDALPYREHLPTHRQRHAQTRTADPSSTT